MQLYNSLTRTKDEFVTNEPGKVKMYTCGPTVYHFAHIGNLRTYIMEDILEKYLQIKHYPTYLLIDRNGEIVDREPPRPSSENQLVDYLNKCLK